MANENAKFDANREKTLLGVTDDANAELRRLLVDPTTGRLLVSAVIGVADIIDDTSPQLGGTLDSNGFAINIIINDEGNDEALTINQNDVTNNPKAVVINNTTTGIGLELNQSGNQHAFVINQTASATGAGLVISNLAANWALDISTTQHGVNINNTAVGGNGKVLSLINAGTNDSLFLDKNNSGNCINIDQDVNDGNDCFGITMDITNAGAGDEFAFKFDGSEIVTASVGGSQDKKIRINIRGTDYFIPCHTA